MEERIREIVEQNTTKTARIRQLILLGVPRTRIAQLLTNGNYGQVQNVYTRMRSEGLLNNITSALATPRAEEVIRMTPRAFEKEFGVELECYNVTPDRIIRQLRESGISCGTGYRSNQENYWKVTTDSSISGINSFELVSPILRGEAGLEQLMKVCRALKKCGAKVNRSCGLHVHLNARNFSLEQWKRIFINYARLENVIDQFMPNSRRANNNTYCRGFMNEGNFERRINQMSSLGRISSILSGRYWKINPQSYSVHNTCEFRQHAGTTDFIKICSWIRFLSNLVDYSENHLVTDRTLEGLKAFNNVETVNYFKYRTLELSA